jgi:hypothetical protein
MAFDVTDPADVAALQTELTTDPISMGYNLNGAVSRLVFLINDPDSNVGGETTGREFDAAALMDALVPSDWDAPQTDAGAPNYAHILIEMAAYAPIEAYKAKFAGMYAANSATVTALNAQTRILSRAEVLFDVGATISENDINIALSS